MAALHLINKGPDHAMLSRCLAVAADGDTIVLLEDGVYCVPDRRVASRFRALRPDCEARGIDASRLSDIELIGYEELVDLVAGHQPIVSWQ